MSLPLRGEATAFIRMQAGRPVGGGPTASCSCGLGGTKTICARDQLQYDSCGATKGLARLPAIFSGSKLTTCMINLVESNNAGVVVDWLGREK